MRDTTEILSVDGVEFEGSCETFVFNRKGAETGEFCKTNRGEYDLSVQVFLLIAKMHLKSRIHVSTDGEQDDWQKAMDICSHMLGYEYKKMDITDNRKLRYRHWE
jgi:hypothetical protein